MAPGTFLHSKHRSRLDSPIKDHKQTVTNIRKLKVLVKIHKLEQEDRLLPCVRNKHSSPQVLAYSTAVLGKSDAVFGHKFYKGQPVLGHRKQ